MTVGELERSATSLEIEEWMVYYRIKNEEWDKKKQGVKEPEQLGNELKAALIGMKRD
jgi:hypothetical protein